MNSYSNVSDYVQMTKSQLLAFWQIGNSDAFININIFVLQFLPQNENHKISCNKPQ